MLRYSSTILPLTVAVDLTGAEVMLSLEQGYTNLSKYVDFEYDPITQKTEIDMALTQEETAKFKANKPVQIMINWVFPNNQRSGSAIAEVPVFENLYRRVMHYGERGN